MAEGKREICTEIYSMDYCCISSLEFLKWSSILFIRAMFDNLRVRKRKMHGFVIRGFGRCL